MKIHILADDIVRKGGFVAELGLSIYIEYKDKKILFDTGQTDVYCQNAKKLSIDLIKTDFIVISHGHYDHCGGLISFPKGDKMPKVYLHKTALNKKYSMNSDGKTIREIGAPWSLDDYKNIEESIVFTENVTHISDDITLCSEIENTCDYASKGLFVENESGKVKDTMQDEQMLIFDTENGLYVYLGCSHPGIISCIKKVVSLYPNKKIHTLVAGMHMGKIDSNGVQKIVEHIEELDIQRLIPLHCTGMFAICQMKNELGDKCVVLTVGDCLEI